MRTSDTQFTHGEEPGTIGHFSTKSRSPGDSAAALITAGRVTPRGSGKGSVVNQRSGPVAELARVRSELLLKRHCSRLDEVVTVAHLLIASASRDVYRLSIFLFSTSQA